jgi:Domain of unknown function (DUF4118)
MNFERAVAAVAVPSPSLWQRYRRRVSTGVALVAPLVVAASLISVRGSYATSAAALTMVVVVTGVAVVGPRSAGLVASLSAALWFDLFLTHPYGRLTIDRGPELETTIAMFVVGVLITELAARSRQYWGAAREANEFSATIRDVAELGATGAHDPEVIERTRTALTGLLLARECRFDPLLESPPLARIEPTGEVLHVGMVWPSGDIGLPGPQCEIVARWRSLVIGRFVLTPRAGRPVSLERRVAAVAVVDAAAAALAGGDRG